MHPKKPMAKIMADDFVEDRAEEEDADASWTPKLLVVVAVASSSWWSLPSEIIDDDFVFKEG